MRALSLRVTRESEAGAVKAKERVARETRTAVEVVTAEVDAMVAADVVVSGTTEVVIFQNTLSATTLPPTVKTAVFQQPL